MAEDVLGCKGKFYMHTSRISNFIIFFFLLHVHTGIEN